MTKIINETVDFVKTYRWWLGALLYMYYIELVVFGVIYSHAV